jgi:hypothetical protein
MKRLILLLAFSGLFSTMLFAQSSPEGMNYQAVARNLKGEILANQPISLKVFLFSLNANGKTTYYNEVHDVVTSSTGVFSLVIGKGRMESGFFGLVPWAKENIWMEVSIKSKGDADFAVISNSQLLAVPYAFHSLTAERLSTDGAGGGSGVPSQNWSLFGNSNSNPVTDKLGVTDSVDLVMVTNNLERLRIYANGDIFMKKSLRIGANLTVDSSAYLNKVGGQTINYGPFTVDRQSPTLLSGTLTVDKETDLNSSLNVDGITDLNSALNVNNASPTKLTGTLRVDGVTDLNSALNVNNMSPTWLTGTLQVDKDGTFKEKLIIESTYQTDTTGSTPSGSLQVGGGAYIAKNLYIGGIAKFGGPAAFGGAVSINDLTQSTSTSTGALIVKGGVGIGRRLNVGEGALFESTVGVTGITTITNATQSTTTANGALIVAGGAGIAKNVNIGGALTTTGITTLNNVLNVNTPASAAYSAVFDNQGANGISIEVGAGTPNNNNDFVTFRKSGGGIVGRIEGETLAELEVNADYVAARDAFIFEVVTGSVDLAIATFEVAQGVVDVAAASSSSTACVGFGACITAPIPSFIIAAGTNLVLKIANAASEATSLAGAITSRNTYVTNAQNSVGVTYQSGSADYAEWLPKANSGEMFQAGYVVGLKNGKITLNTTNAEKLFVISTKPIVLGNMPEEGKESNYEKVAFMGQVPVQVLGKVNAGDYILPSGKNNGLAIAVSPDKMKPEDYTRIVGVAWASSENAVFGKVNTAIGLNTGDVSKVVADQAKEITDLKSRINETNAILARLVPGFKEAAGIKGNEVSILPPNPPAGHNDHAGEISANASNIVYFEVSKDQLNAMFAMAEKLFIDNGGDMSTHPFWKRIKSEPGFKEATMQQVAEKFRAAMHTHQDINKQFLRGK